ncbi:MAG: 4-hydroxythreonine-4-phosphate dehydrogenase PdxA [candidate division NC10 bacterium]|nr:4-hydroxythreonine-4-phosphate dehydrogenase PdxA [candidate division NC10 bacterium]MBI2115085.1 4-hydroxythreonine-4-phosphate dehydrogenase PdxA [candidate division NC10 bacterium]MBI2164362.1 4-hydroxythreonine-4-phosphate dehydrogenase PdxA [candidate division NC10 bacterium]
MSPPTVAVTMGDPAGVGPEIVVRALGEKEVRAACHPVVVGDPRIMVRALELVKSPLRVRTVQAARGAGADPGTLDVLPAGEVDPATLAPGKLDARWGKSCAQCVERAVLAAQAGEAGGIVSAPLNKETFHMAGYTAMDDMTFFQECFAAGEAYQVGEVAGLWTTPVTFHVPFRQIPDLITVEAVLGKIRTLRQVMAAAKVSPLKIGVAALNVHAGEGGMFGREEIDVIRPAIETARAEGVDVVGPIPADSFFPMALRGDFRGLVFMYHDQANIGRKILGREQPGVSLFLGMPVPVATVPHGTAYDIAWKGVAKHAMIVRAITMAAALATSR